MNTQAPRADLMRKLMARALDPAAPDPEAMNSAAKFASVARRDGVTLDVLPTVFPPALPPPRQEVRPDACNLEIWFGKHAGMSLLAIGRKYPQYLRWLASDELENDEIRQGAGEVITYLKRRAGK
jgi:hypothetical protein